MKNIYDIAIIGSGPAGSSTALEACRLGLENVCLLDKAVFPRSKPCAGGISPRARTVLKQMGLWRAVKDKSYDICGMRLVSPYGREAILEGAESASVLNRMIFDKILLDAAINAGASFLSSTRVIKIESTDENINRIVTESGEIFAKWVVAADGANGHFSNYREPRTILHSAIASYEGIKFSPHIIEMIYDSDLHPHYGWLFPESETRANIGICMSREKLGNRPIKAVFDTFLQRYYQNRITGAIQVTPVRGHPISTSVKISHKAPPGILLAGEAARLANYATGEGISYAMISGRLAARAIKNGLDENLGREEISNNYVACLKSDMSARMYISGLFCKHAGRIIETVAVIGNNRLFKYLSNRFSSN